jgi:hypothetical protein
MIQVKEVLQEALELAPDERPAPFSTRPAQRNIFYPVSVRFASSSNLS